MTGVQLIEVRCGRALRLGMVSPETLGGSRGERGGSGRDLLCSNDSGIARAVDGSIALTDARQSEHPCLVRSCLIPLF